MHSKERGLFQQATFDGAFPNYLHQPSLAGKELTSQRLSKDEAQTA